MQQPIPGYNYGSYYGVQRHRAVAEYPTIMNGYSKAKSVLVENGQEFLIKGPSLVPQHPYIAANELLVAQLAGCLGLPILVYGIIELQGQLFFGSHWMEQASFFDSLTPELFAQCENQERVYPLVVLDTWVCNVDRHNQNLLVRRPRPRGANVERKFLLLNDHSHCLVLPDRAPSRVSDLGTFVDTSLIPYTERLDIFVREAIRDPLLLQEALSAVEAIPDTTIATFVRLVPIEFLPLADQDPLIDFLTARKARLRDIFNRDRAHFPNLGGGTL